MLLEPERLKKQKLFIFMQNKLKFKASFSEKFRLIYAFAIFQHLLAWWPKRHKSQANTCNMFFGLKHFGNIFYSTTHIFTTHANASKYSLKPQDELHNHKNLKLTKAETQRDR